MKNLIITAITFFMFFNAFGHEVWTLNSKYLKSPGKVMVFKPQNYQKSKSYPLVYLLHGYSENYTQWSKTTDLQRLANQYQFIIVTPEGFTSYYINSHQPDGDQYEDFFFKELLPMVHQSLSIDKQNVFIGGLSMGGYGALRYFILNQDYFNTAASTSGALEIDFNELEKASKQFWQSSRMTNDLKKVFGRPDENDWHQYSISNLLTGNQNFKKPFLMDCGTSDILYPASLTVKLSAEKLGIPISFISQPGDHNTEYWNKAIEYHFIYFKQHLR
ncbi:alpha/beta hydrolase [Pedobacter vanadiisoli]|uniref:Alpha/beta hydrolase n=1 Tax=Pedobacter vanadiisoli TaxID=1761975 RepID=A0ABW5MMV9_9SPHI